MSVNIGIIGCGSIAKSHLQGYRSNGAQIMAVADVNPDAAKALSKEAVNAKCFNDYKGLLDSGLVQAVSICTPPAFHEEAVIYSLEHNIHVLCEKPLANTCESAGNIINAGQKSSAFLMTAFRHRFLPAINRIKKIIKQGQLGIPVLFRNIFCGSAFEMSQKWFSIKKIAGGGSIMDTSSHSVDLFRYLVGEITEQQSIMHRHLNGTDVEDTAILLVKSENGTLGSLTSSWVAGSDVSTIDIIGTKGQITYDYIHPCEIRLKLQGEKEWQVIPVESSDGFTEEIAHFLAAIKGEQELTCTGQDGQKALSIIQGCYI